MKVCVEGTQKKKTDKEKKRKGFKNEKINIYQIWFNKEDIKIKLNEVKRKTITKQTKKSVKLKDLGLDK